MNKSLQQYYKHRERRIVEMRVARNTPRIRASALVSGARRRADKLKCEFDLDIDWLTPKIEAGQCEVSGIPFVLTSGRHAFAPSLDRTDPKKGYTKDNTKVVVWTYNAAKGIGTHEQVVTLAEALLGR